jgi:chromate transporter
MFHEIVEVRNWMDSQTFMNGIVLGQITPGPIVITATYVGYLLSGLFGGVVATFSVFFPSFMLVVALSPYFDRLRTSQQFKKIISGVLCSFVGLLLTVTIRFGLNVHWDLSHSLLASGALIALLLKVDVLWVVIAGTIISVILFV